MDKIQKIPSGLEKYLGVGDMVLPSEETLRNELAKLPTGKLTSIPLLRESIANQLGVTTACPKTSLKMLRGMMNEKNSGAFKVLNGKGELVASDPELQAELLKVEGFEIDDSKAKYKVKDFKNSLVN
jgi:alkylated DNA nucleotide flippase Atl1